MQEILYIYRHCPVFLRPHHSYGSPSTTHFVLLFQTLLYTHTPDVEHQTTNNRPCWAFPTLLLRIQIIQEPCQAFWHLHKACQIYTSLVKPFIISYRCCCSIWTNLHINRPCQISKTLAYPYLDLHCSTDLLLTLPNNHSVHQRHVKPTLTSLTCPASLRAFWITHRASQTSKTLAKSSVHTYNTSRASRGNVEPSIDSHHCFWSSISLPEPPLN